MGSTYGGWLDFAAPANIIVGPELGPSDYFDFEECEYDIATWNSGTSFAAPAVAGVAGLLRSIEPRLLGEDVHQLLARTARDLHPPGFDDSSGHGLSQARAALDYLDRSNKVFAQGRIGAYGTQGSLGIADSTRALRTFLNFPQLACTSCAESTTVYRLRGEATFGSGYTTVPDVWARSSGSVGFLDTTIVDYQSEVYRGRILPGSVTSAACSLETYVFCVDGVGWIPAPPESARIAYSSLGPSSLVGVDPPRRAQLQTRAYPNPTRGLVRFEITGHEGGHARTDVYDVRGRRVRVLHDGPLLPGDHAQLWDARDGRGMRVLPGAYFIRYDRAGQSMDRKVVLIGRPSADR